VAEAVGAPLLATTLIEKSKTGPRAKSPV